jgi:tetratricopeptide (TPR) repeat protein
MQDVTHEDLGTQFELLKQQPEKFLELANEFLRKNPQHAGGYFSRHHAWQKLGQLQRALDDLDTSLMLEPHPVTYRAKGRNLYLMKQYEKAIEAFTESRTMDPAMWIDAYGALYRADCYARLGDEAAALADCALLKDSHFLPYGLFGTPRGNKQDVIEEIRRRAAAARHGRSSI